MASLEPFIHRKLVILHHNVPAYQAARAMCEKGVGCILVCDEHGHLIGIVTDRDLMSLLLTTATVQADIPLSELMSSEPVTIDQDQSLEEAIQIMEESGVRRLPVVQQLHRNEQKCIGLVTVDDLIALKKISIESLSRIISSQVKNATSSDPARASRSEARSEAHMAQTLNHFYKVMAEKLQLNLDLTIRLTRYILKSLTGRLHYRGAAHFIAQLPKGLQDDLLDLPAGPNRDITAEVILKGVTSLLGGDRSQAKIVLVHFFDGFGALLDLRTLEYVWGQLPQDIRMLFVESVAVKGFRGKTSAA